MGRPTSDRKTKTLIIRINDETRESLESKASEEGKTLSDYARDILIGGKQKNNVIQKNTEFRQDLMDRAVERDIGEMCKLSGISTHDFYRGICELFTDGQIGIDEGRVRSFGEYDLRDFESVCYRLHQRPKEMLEKLTRSLERSV